MARSNKRSVKFVEPGRYILNMVLFLTAVAAVVFYLSPYSPDPSPVLIDAFAANPALNGFILFVLAFGIIYYLRQAGVISPAVRWVEAFRDRARLPKPPMLISAMTNFLLDADEKDGKTREREVSISAETTRSILDSIGTRMDEGRENGRYIGHLLVFLGLLGTFWGLIETVNGVVNTISGLAVSGGAAEDAIAQLITNLKAPLAGMGTAFSSSLFGLAGSLVVGFLDLQASQAQGRFYTDLEDWLSGMTESRAAASGVRSSLGSEDAPFASLEAAFAANTDALIKAQASQIGELKDEIRALNRSIIRAGKE
ncbi:MAG: hypothetical protein ACKVS5_09040 [Parvularculaceae bacterium]